MKKLIMAEFNVKTANRVASEIANYLGLKKAKASTSNGRPAIVHWDDDAEEPVLDDMMMFIDEHFCIDLDDSFNDVFGYVYSFWGKDSKGDWYLAYDA